MKQINNIFGGFFLLEGVYLLYNFVRIFVRLINSFDTSIPGNFIIVGIYLASIVLFIFTGIGLLRGKKKWAIISGWIAVILPQLLLLALPFAVMPLQNNNFILILNLASLFYLSIQFKKPKLV